MTLVVTPLYDNEFEVSGTDYMGKDNSTVLESESWAAYLYVQRHKQATEVFDAEVEQGLAWLHAAVDKAKAVLDEGDDYSVVTVTEGTEGVTEEKFKLDRNGRILNLLAQGQHDRVRWSGDRLVAVKK